MTEDRRLLRLYPVRFRRLEPSRRFNRFDWISALMAKASDDPRPESYRMKEDSISVLKRAREYSPEERARLWAPCVSPSLTALDEERERSGRSLGIVRPDPGSARFIFKPVGSAEKVEQEELQVVYKMQQSLFEEPLKPLPEPEYVFRYRFTSAGKEHSMQLHDWEVQATYAEYKRRYGCADAALEKMVDYFENRVPNLHLIMGTMYRAPWQFIAIGVLRTTADLEHVDDQPELF